MRTSTTLLIIFVITFILGQSFIKLVHSSAAHTTQLHSLTITQQRLVAIGE